MDATLTTARRRWADLAAPATVAATGLVGAIAVHVVDPNVAGNWGPAGVGLCPFHAITGLWCPGCGGLRAVHALTDLDLAAAVSANVLAVVLVGLLVAAWARWTSALWRGRDGTAMVRLTPWTGNAVLVVLVVFTVLRNLPLGSALAP